MISARVYFSIYVVLMILLALTLGAAYIHLGLFNPVVAMSISIVKAFLIILYFMHIRYSGRLRWVFAGIGFFWLAILLVLAMTDYFTRGWLPLPAGWE
jgi:cytochrome c oxidase subunit 4